MNTTDPVDVALGRHIDAVDADEAFDEWLAGARATQAEAAAGAMANASVWVWDAPAAGALYTTEGVAHTCEGVLVAALNSCPDTRSAYAALMASDAAQPLRRAIAGYWASTMWETRGYFEAQEAFRAAQAAYHYEPDEPLD